MAEFAVFVVISVAFIITLCVLSVMHNRALQNRFPPISDAEFLDRCSPGVSPEVALKVRQIVAKHFAIAYERVRPSMTFVEDIGAD